MAHTRRLVKTNALVAAPSAATNHIRQLLLLVRPHITPFLLHFAALCLGVGMSDLGLEPLQETLGDLNGISVHEGLTERLAARRRASSPFLRMRSGLMPVSQKPDRSGGRPEQRRA